MRIKKLSLVSVSLLMAFGALAGCSKNDDKPTSSEPTTSTSEPPAGPGELTNLAIAAGFKTSYEPSETIPWSSLKIIASYNGSNDVEFTNEQIAFDVSEVPAGKEVVVYTSNLHAQTGTLTEGNYDISAAVKEDLTKKYSLGTIRVATLTPEKYDLELFPEPENIATFKANRKKDHAAEGSFFNGDDELTVGSRNVFRFEPEAVFTDLSTFETVVATNYRKQYSLRELPAKTPVEFSTYAEVVQGGVKFKSAAHGKKFELRVSPVDFMSLPVSVNVQIEDGLNVYSAKELGALNLTQYTQADFATYAHRYAYHYGADGEFDNDQRKVFWNSELEDWTHLDTTGLWRSWLVNRSVFTATEEVAYQDLPGVYLQNDIKVTKADIPSEFFINSKEKQTVDTDSDGHYDVEGCIRDYVDIYKPIVHNNDVVVNGNYFALDSDLGSTRSRGGDDTIYYDDNYTVPNPDFQPGHSTLIKFCGLLPSTNWHQYYKNNIDLVGGHKGVLKNLSSNGYVSTQYSPIPAQEEGEDPVDYAARVEKIRQRDAIMSVTGLIFAKNAFCGADYTNLVLKQYQIALFPDNMVQGSREHAGAHGEGTINYNTLIDQVRIYDCPNCGICNYQNKGTIVQHSDMKRYGGSSLVNMGYRASEEQHTGSEAVPYDNRKAVTYYMSDVTTENFIDGTETYFKTVNANLLFTLLDMYASFFNEVGNSFREDKKYNLLGLNFDGSALGSDNKEFFADFVMDYDKSQGEGYLNASCGDNYYFRLYTELMQGNKPVIADHSGYPEEYAPAMPEVQTPLFVTDKGEMFTSLFSSTFTDCKLHKVTPTAGDDGILGTMDDSVSVNVAHMTSADQLQGKKMFIYLPAGATTCIAAFELKQVSAA